MATVPSTRIPTESLNSCPNCRSVDTKFWCSGTDLLLRTSGQQYEYRRCKNCGIIFLNTRPLPAMLDRIYPEPYHPHHKRPPKPVCESRPRRLAANLEARMFGPSRETFRKRVESYYAELKPGSVFLDFGCGAGRYLDLMNDRGCLTIGMDFSQRALQQVAESGHRAVSVTDAGWKSIATDSVDFVRGNHVLEHLFELEQPITALKEKLRSGGVMHLALPNPQGISASVFRRYWHGLDCPRHAVLYPPHVLAKLLERLGFKVEDVLLEPVTKDHIRSWVYLFQHFGALGERSPDDYIERPVLALLAGLPVSVAIAVGRGDRFHIFARKQR